MKPSHAHRMPPRLIHFNRFSNAWLYRILRILSVTLFEKTPLLQTFHAPKSQDVLSATANQLILFDFLPDSSDQS
jgi:hypothetical protein